MGTTIASLLPIVVGAAVLPLWIILTLLLLHGEGGVLKAAAFATGGITVRVVQGVLFGYVFGAAADASGEDLITSTLLLVVGVLMLITAANSWLKENDPDAPPPRWMRTLGGVSALTAFGMGALLMAIDIKQWVFTLSAIAVIDEADLSQASSVLAYLAFVVAAQSLVLAPVIVAAAAPAHSAKLLDVAQGWLERNNRAMTIVVSLVFGGWFLWKGISGLLAHDQPLASPNVATGLGARRLFDLTPHIALARACT